MTDELYALRANYDQPLNMLLRINQIAVPGDDQPFAGPKAVALYDPGVTKIRLNGMTFDSGFYAVVWQFGFMYLSQWQYLSTTYCGGKLSGKVTISTTLGDPVTYSRMNAIMVLKKPKDMRSNLWYQAADVTFTRLATAA